MHTMEGGADQGGASSIDLRRLQNHGQIFSVDCDGFSGTCIDRIT